MEVDTVAKIVAKMFVNMVANMVICMVTWLEGRKKDEVKQARRAQRRPKMGRQLSLDFYYNIYINRINIYTLLSK